MGSEGKPPRGGGTFEGQGWLAEVKGEKLWHSGKRKNRDGKQHFQIGQWEWEGMLSFMGCRKDWFGWSWAVGNGAGEVGEWRPSGRCPGGSVSQPLPQQCSPANHVSTPQFTKTSLCFSYRLWVGLKVTPHSPWTSMATTAAQETKPNSTDIFNPVLWSHSPTCCWWKPVTWPSPPSMWREGRVHDKLCVGIESYYQ